MPNGLRLQFAATDDLLAMIARTIDAERQSWRFLRFGMTVEPDGGPITLELTGPSRDSRVSVGVARRMIYDLFSPNFRQPTSFIDPRRVMIGVRVTLCG